MSFENDLERLNAMAIGEDSDSDVDSGVGNDGKAEAGPSSSGSDGEAEGVEVKNVLLGARESAGVVAYVRSLRAAMAAGQGETIVEVGVDAEGSGEGLEEEELKSVLDVLEGVADEELSSVATVLRTKETGEGWVAEVLVRAKPDAAEFCEIRVAVIGNVDSGKSTLLGVLTRGALDDGRGKARECIFRHSHEIESGRTSSISQEILGFDGSGGVVNYTFERTPSWSAICESSSKVISFLDLAGHERYLKTTLFGLTGLAPSFAVLMVGANAGVIGMTKEHFGLSLSLKIPLFLVVTKIDMAPPNVLKRTVRQLTKLVKSPGSRKVPLIIKTMDDVIVAARSFTFHRICPIFLVSNVTGENLDLVRAFINLLPARGEWTDLSSEPTQYTIDDTFSVPGVGCVVSGTVLSGSVEAGDTLLMGPNKFGTFEPVTIKSIEVRRHAVKRVTAGHAAALALKKIKRSDIRKGMRLLDVDLNPMAVWEFEAEILILYHSTTISKSYEAVIHCGNVRQVAKIVQILEASSVASGKRVKLPTDADGTGDGEEGDDDDNDQDIVLRTGMKARVLFRFLYAPEYLPVDGRLIFRDGRTKGVGKVVKLREGTTKPVSARASRRNRRRARVKGGAGAGPNVGPGSVGSSSSRSSSLAAASADPSAATRSTTGSGQGGGGGGSGGAKSGGKGGKRRKKRKMVVKPLKVKS